MRKIVRKKIVWDKHGVSDIIGDILILSITVVLFAAIFAFVWNLPTPNEGTYADVDGSIDLDATGGRINLTHTSGEDLPEASTKIYIYKNQGLPSQDVRELNIKSTTGDADNPFGYGLSGDDVWSAGEHWTYYFTGVTSADDLELRIIDTTFSQIIASGKLLGAGANDAPIIMERWYFPDPAANATTLNLYVKVRDPDGFSDISAPGSIYANISALNKTYSVVNFQEVSSTLDSGVFKGSITIDKGTGTYTITISARDTAGLIDRGRIVVDVTYTVLNNPRILERWSIPEVGVNGTDIIIKARVEDLDGYDNIDYVSINATSLGASAVVNMTDPERDGIFEYTTTVDVFRGDLYNVSFNAVDITGLQDNAYLKINIKKFKPVIAKTWTVDPTGKDEETITVFAEVSDPDGYDDIDYVRVNVGNLTDPAGAPNVINMTDPEEDGVFETSLLTIDVVSGGNKNLTFEARDLEGNNVTAMGKVWVYTRFPPVILERWTDPHFPDNNSQLQIFARVMDLDGYEDINFTGSVRVNIAELDRNLSFSNGWINMTDPNWDGNFMAFTLVDEEAGTYMIRFQATDMGGNMANSTLNLTILPYRPKFLNVWTNPQVGRNGSQIQIFANVMDPNGYMDIANVTVDIVQLNQSLNQSQAYWVDMTDYNRNGTYSYEMMINVSDTGIYTLNFTIMDRDGNQANLSHLLLVTSNKPIIIETGYEPDPALNNTNVTIYAWIWDDDGINDIIQVSINVSELNTNMTWVNMTDSDEDRIYINMSFINAINATGFYNVTIVAYDTTGNSVIKTFQIEVGLEAGPGDEQNPTVFGMANPNAVSMGSQVWFSAYANNGSRAEDKITQVRFWWGGTPYYMDRIYENYFRYPNPFSVPIVTESQTFAVDIDALNTTGGIVATDTIRLLVMYDETGGEVTKPTALQKMVAWIAHDQGFVITNNKTSNKTVQVFELFDSKDAFCHVKVGSNVITNTEKMNLFRLTSRTTGEIIGAPYLPDDLKFQYDGVMAGYWFFNLSFSTELLYDYIDDNTGPGPNQFPAGTNAEYFDVYIYLKDTTDDYFMTESWIVVTDSDNPDFYAYLNNWYDVDYIPGVPIIDTSPADKIPDDGIQGPASDYHTFQNTEVVYVEIITYDTGSASSASFTNLEIQDFWGNHMVSNPPNSGAVGPISTHVDGLGDTHYIVAVDLLRADKDPWLMGKVAYTIIITGFSDANEEFAYLAKQIVIESPSSIMDIVNGHEHAGGGTWSDKYHGHFYENQNGYFEKYLYAYSPGSNGQTDYMGEIWSVAFEDLDGDSDREIVTGRAGDNNPTLSIWENLGGGYFDEVEIDYFSDEINSVATGQVYEVGWNKPYDVVIGTSGGDVYYYRNDGFWDLTATIASLGGSVSVGHAIEIGDLDNDGDGDVVVGGSFGVRILQNPRVGGGGWTTINLGSPGTVMSVAIGYLEEDYDIPGTEDPYLDIVVGDADGDIYRYLNDDSDISAGSWDESTINTQGGAHNVYVDIGNIDGLTYLDVVAGWDSSLYWYRNNDGGSDWDSFGSITGTLPNPSNHVITAVSVGNIDGAIEDDIAIATTGESQGQSFSGGLIYYYRNLGRASDWMRFTVDNLFRLGGEMDIYSIAIGDADLGS